MCAEHKGIQGAGRGSLVMEQKAGRGMSWWGEGRVAVEVTGKDGEMSKSQSLWG